MGYLSRQSIISVITIVADAFRVLIPRALWRNLFSGFMVGKDVVEVSDLQYWNTQFFETCYILLWTCFRPQGELEEDLKEQMTMLGFPLLRLLVLHGRNPYFLFGPPVGGNPCSDGFWQPILKRLRRKLASSKVEWISLLGATSSDLPVCYFFIFKIPKKYVAPNEQLQRNSFGREVKT